MIILKKIYHVINALIRRGYWFDHVFFENCRKFNTYSVFNTDVINLGSTSALYAFNYEGINIKAANFALAHNPLAADWAVLRNYVSFLNPQKSVVIIPLCPFGALAGSYEAMDDRYYSILYPSTIPSYSFSRDLQIQEKYKHPVRHYPFYALFLDLFKLIVKRKFKVLSEVEMENDSHRWIDSWKLEFSIKDFAQPLSLVNKDGISDAASLLDKIVRFCIEHNGMPVIVIPPMYHTLGEKITPIMRKVLIDGLFSEMKEDGYKFFNYIDDLEFSNNRSFFVNSFLLNEKGAKEFTKKLLKAIGLVN